MGLTIHYHLSLPGKPLVPEVRQKLSALRQACLDLPFQEVGEVLEFKGTECNFRQRDQNDPLRWFLCQADSTVIFKYDRTGKPVAVSDWKDGTNGWDVLPEQVIGFRTYPGNGCEEANVGLSRFPKAVSIPNQRTGKNQRLSVADGGNWQWHSFCKTQYANEHGLEHFLRCHLSVVAMLDAAKKLGFMVTVNDEGGYWEKRDVQVLVREIGEWDRFIAGFGGTLKDIAGNAGMTIQAPIFNRKDFEQLEMQGQAFVQPSLKQLVLGLLAKTKQVSQ